MRCRDDEKLLSAFVRGPKERQFAVFVDVEGCKDAALTEILRGFGGNPHVRVEELRLNQIQLDDAGCATLDREHGGKQARDFFRMAGHNLNMLPKSGVELNFDQDPEIGNRLILAMFAWRIGCDAFVTESAQVLAIAPRFYRQANVMRPTEALATIGLHLRLRDDFVYKQLHGARVETDGEDFYSALAHDLLPEGWRWYGACPTSASVLEPSAGGLAIAIHDRVARAVRSRDRMLGCLFRVPTTSTIDEALFYFDGFLVALAGAFDAAARVVAKTYRTPRIARASWRNPDWLREVAKSNRALAALSSPGTETRDMIELLFVLRNLVHEEPLRVVGEIGPSGDIVQYKAGVSRRERQALERPIQRRGGLEMWGVRELGDGAIAIDLRVYVERLLPRACQQLNQLMKATEVERFGLLRKGAFLRGPPSEILERLAPFRLLGGIEVPEP